MAVFTDVVDFSIGTLWNRVNLAIVLHCLPSEIDNESNRDMQAIMTILSAQHEKVEQDKDMEANKWH